MRQWIMTVEEHEIPLYWCKLPLGGDVRFLEVVRYSHIPEMFGTYNLLTQNKDVEEGYVTEIWPFCILP